MTINLTDPANHPANSPLTGGRINRVIEALESSLAYRNDIADAVKGLRELQVSREAQGEPVMYCSAETIAAAQDGEPLLRTLSAPSGDCFIPLFIAPPAPIVPTFDEWLKNSGQKPLGWVKDAMRESYNACRAAILTGE